MHICLINSVCLSAKIHTYTYILCSHESLVGCYQDGDTHFRGTGHAAALVSDMSITHIYHAIYICCSIFIYFCGDEYMYVCYRRVCTLQLCICTECLLIYMQYICILYILHVLYIYIYTNCCECGYVFFFPPYLFFR